MAQPAAVAAPLASSQAMCTSVEPLATSSAWVSPPDEGSGAGAGAGSGESVEPLVARGSAHPQTKRAAARAPPGEGLGLGIGLGSGSGLALGLGLGSGLGLGCELHLRGLQRQPTLILRVHRHEAHVREAATEQRARLEPALGLG
jgi:hypothetical protein